MPPSRLEANTRRVTIDSALGDQRAAPVAVFANVKSFDGEPFNGDYGPTVKRAVLEAILTLDPRRVCRFQTLWGSLMLPVYRPTSANSGGALALGADPFLLWTSASNLCKNAETRWVIPAATVPWLLATNSRIYLGTLSGLPTSLHGPLHRALTAQSWYVGLMPVDRADSLHHRIFSLLLPGWCYNQGWITENSHGRDPREAFRDLPVAGYGPGPNPLGASDLPIPWSPRTSITETNPQTYQEALTTLLADYTEAERPLAFIVGRRHPIADDLYGKLHDYALNPAHEQGGAVKAAFFRTALGLEQEHWRLLAVQLISALAAGNPAKFRDERRFGRQQQLRFEITAPVLGLNGKTAVVTAAWKIEDDDPVQLVTLTPGKKAGIVEQDKAFEAGDWAALHAIAVEVAEQARRNYRPTPIAFTGDHGVEAIAEGVAGFAWVTFTDPGSPFVAWLRNQGRIRADDTDATIAAPTFHYEPATAWAEAFAAVLRAAGHDCTVTHAVD